MYKERVKWKKEYKLLRLVSYTRWWSVYHRRILWRMRSLISGYCVYFQSVRVTHRSLSSLLLCLRPTGLQEEPIVSDTPIWQTFAWCHVIFEQCVSIEWILLKWLKLSKVAKCNRTPNVWSCSNVSEPLRKLGFSHRLVAISITDNT